MAYKYKLELVNRLPSSSTAGDIVTFNFIDLNFSVKVRKDIHIQNDNRFRLDLEIESQSDHLTIHVTPDDNTTDKRGIHFRECCIKTGGCEPKYYADPTGNKKYWEVIITAKDSGVDSSPQTPVTVTDRQNGDKISEKIEVNSK